MGLRDDDTFASRNTDAVSRVTGATAATNGAASGRSATSVDIRRSFKEKVLEIARLKAELAAASINAAITALRSTPELASPSVKISFLFKGFLLLFPIRDLIDAKKFDANFPSALAASICFLDAKIWNLASEDPFLASK